MFPPLSMKTPPFREKSRKRLSLKMPFVGVDKDDLGLVVVRLITYR